MDYFNNPEIKRNEEIALSLNDNDELTDEKIEELFKTIIPENYYQEEGYRLPTETESIYLRNALTTGGKSFEIYQGRKWTADAYRIYRSKYFSFPLSKNDSQKSSKKQMPPKTNDP